MSDSQIRTLRNVSAVLGLVMLAGIGIALVGLVGLLIYSIALLIYNNVIIISESITLLVSFYILIKLLLNIKNGRR